MSVDHKDQTKSNGTEIRDNLETSELDPCMEDSKDKRKSDFFHRYRDRACEKSGLSHKGLYIVGGIVILAFLLFIVVIALAAAWPRIPHKYQFPVCQDPDCLEAAAQIQEGLNKSVSPCEDLWQATCGGWLKKYPLPKDRSVWDQKQQLLRRESERVRDLIATLELPLHLGTVEWKMKHMYEACLDVDNNVESDDARPLLDIISQLAVARGKPSGSYSYPAPTPSAAPALFSTPTPSLAPQILNLASPTPSLAPSVLGYPTPTPSIAPSLFDNGQYGSPVVNIGGHSLGDQSLGLQSLGIQSLGGIHPLGVQPLSFGLSQSQIGFPFTSPGLSFGNYGGQLLSLGSPQLSFGSPQLSFGSSQLSFGTSELSGTPAPDFGLTSSQLNTGSAISSISTSNLGVQGPTVQHTGGVIVQKHVYVHVPPEEPEERHPPRPIVVPPPRRNYKIIFIKAPTPPTPTAPVIPPQPQDDERTLVYVLVRRPEEQPEIKIQAPPPTLPSKPEVYFIRYDTRKESIAGGSIPSGPVPIENGHGSVSVVDDVIRGGDATISPIRIGDSGLHTSVPLNLNTASLNGGSALSLAVTGSPVDSAVQISSTPTPRYGVPEHK